MGEPETDPRVLRFGVFELDRRAGELRKSGVRVRLQEQPLRVLEALLVEPGGPVSREALRQRLWPDEAFGDFDNGLNRAINRLRAALGDEAENPRFIETLDRRGYRFMAPVRVAAPAVAAPMLDEPPPTRPARRRLFVWGGALAAALAAGGLLAAALKERGVSSATEPPIRSLAVLPLANLSLDPGQDYFSDGMTDALITNLASLDDVRVISRQSVMRYRNSTLALPEIARELGVDAVVEGSVLRAGNRVRITAQLVHGATDRHLWAESYDRPLEDVLTLQAEIAEAVRAQVRRHVASSQNGRQGPRRRAVLPPAYEQYLQGRFNTAQLAPASLERSVECFERALGLDPAFAPAYAGLAQARFLQEFWGGRPRTEEHAEEVRQTLRKALDLDPDLAEARDTLGRVLLHYDWDWKGAEAEFRRAIALEPNSAVAHNGLSILLQSLVRFDEALVEAGKTVALDPQAAWALAEEGRVLYRARRYAEAEDRYRRARALDPGFGPALDRLVQLYLTERRLGDAQEALDRLIQLPSHRARSLVTLRARLAATSGDAVTARRLIAELEDSAPFAQAAIQVALGDHPRAFAALQEAVERKTMAPYAWSLPELDPLRRDPRFAHLVARMGLPVDRLAALPGRPTGP